tara:strand:+ start:45890 stop:46726 length:837 start_codon:yes stop_codon:yes gene_type:complete
MKKLLLLVLLTISLVSCNKVPAGNVGIKFFLLGGDKGVDYGVLTPGRYHIGMNEELFLFETFNQNKTWTSNKEEGSETNDEFVFQSSKGLRLTASVGIEFHINKEDVPRVFETYKKGFQEITDKVLRNSLRDAFNMAGSQRTAEDVYGSGKVSFMNEVFEIATRTALEKGITIDDIYLIGNVGIPNGVTEALNSKIKAGQLAQQREDELRQTIAEAKKVGAEAEGKAKAIMIEAVAQAKANRIISESITTNLIKYKEIEKWDGVKPKVLGGNALVDLR